LAQAAKIVGGRQGAGPFVIDMIVPQVEVEQLLQARRQGQNLHGEIAELVSFQV